MQYPRFLSLLLLAALLGGCPEPGMPSNVHVVSDLVYAQAYVSETPYSPGGGRQFELHELMADVYVPDDQPGVAKPAVLVIHGGAFLIGSRENDNLRAYAARIASAGYVCFLIDYRLESDAPPAPGAWGNSTYTAAIHAAAVDANAALRYMFAQAEIFEIDTKRVVALGASAGAITALNVGMSDPGAFTSDGPGYTVPGGNNAGQPTELHAIVDLWGSAAFVLEEIDVSDPPVLIVHGKLDITPAASFADSLVLERSLEENGVPFEFYPIPRAGHEPWNAEVGGRDLAEITLDFLETYLAPSAG